ncbi:hypothetical protein AVEN_53835-1 [Araneus ventricosus]|uniref:Uncharacterized protein n=1 Tax=Araneus ventricosus TaxID=182803 RepID=A0A4Y2EXL9_ARAVE|nr:hypothetical protein AVEN_53835-1 [Araneus ventricosus]
MDCPTDVERVIKGNHAIIYTNETSRSIRYWGYGGLEARSRFQDRRAGGSKPNYIVRTLAPHAKSYVGPQTPSRRRGSLERGRRPRHQTAVENYKEHPNVTPVLLQNEKLNPTAVENCAVGPKISFLWFQNETLIQPN